MATAKPKYKGAKVTTPVGRASYPAIFQPKLKYQSTTEFEYAIEVLFAKDTDLSDFKKKCDIALAEVYGNVKANWPKNISMPLVDQEILIEKAKEKGQAHEHLVPGAMYARFKTNAKNGKPVIVDREMNAIIDPTKVYGGCFVSVSAQLKVVEIKGKDPVTKKDVVTVYVTPYLQGVMFVKDGDAFGGRQSAAEMFEAVTFDNDEAGAESIIG